MIPIISIKSLLTDGKDDSVDDQIGRACMDVGFFIVVDHGVSKDLQRDLEVSTKRFFDLPKRVKNEIHMSRALKAWRGYFSVGEELTSSVVDEKEGIYFGSETPEDKRPLHGSNLYPNKEMSRVVPLYMKQMTKLGRTILRSIARFLKVSSEFENQFNRPTTLFRAFHYPPHDPKLGSQVFGVGEHTDYGYLTILKTDDVGGLQVKMMNGSWSDVKYVENGLIINLGDALEHNTQGLLRATPHRVIQRKNTTRSRYSWPFFFDPNFDTEMINVKLPPSLELIARKRREDERSRWDGKDPKKYRGTYGNYLMQKVSKVFPELARKSKL